VQSKKENLIVDLTFEFALMLIQYCEVLEERKRFVVAKQLLRAGTSVGANVREAQNAESKPDFIHKMKIASKEADEAEYWLMLCKESKNYPDCNLLIEKITSISRVLSKIIGTSKRKNLSSSNFQIN
jgi:four helix bundle protein